jgi:O-antigen/teichoic acid export membrane protein
MHSLNNISKNSLFILTEKMMKIVTYLFAGIIIARYVGPKNFGLYTSFLSLNIIFIAISALGLNSLLVKEYVKTSELSLLFTNAIFIRLLSCVFFSLLSIPIALFIIDAEIDTTLLSALIIIMSATSVIDMFFESKLKSSVIAKYKTLGYIFGFTLKVFAAIYFKSSFYLILAHLLETFIILLLAVLSFKIQCPNVFKPKVVEKKYSIYLLRLGFPLLLSSIAGIIYMKIDQLFVVNMLGKESAGYYATSVRLCEGLFILSSVILPSFFPNLIKMYEKARANFNKLLRVLFFSLLLAGISLALFVVTFSEDILLVIYGELYSNPDSVKVLQWFACCIPIVYIGELFSRWLIISNNTYLSIYRHLLGLTINLLLNYLLIPIYGIEGAAIATLVAYVFSVIIFSVFSTKARLFYSFLSKES